MSYVLPFYVTPILTRQASPEDLPLLQDLLAARSAAYGRHLPEFAQGMITLESDDLVGDATQFILRSKEDHSIVGGFRYQSNQESKLPLEHSITLPEHQAQVKVAEASRLFVLPQPQFVRDHAASIPALKLALFKLFFEHCQRQDVTYMTITARDPLDRMYERIGFTDVFESGKFYPIGSIAQVPHRVLTLKVQDLTRDSLAPRWPEMSEFFFDIKHPDFDL